jgi:hypothetical protein
LRERDVTPHIGADGHLSKTGKARKAAIDGRTLRHPGYGISQCCRNASRRCSAGQDHGGARPGQGSLPGQVQANFTLAIVAYSLVRLPKLLEAR